jgi:dTMP kinase
MTRGKFITFEGGEGTGKSTQARLLFERLKSSGVDVLLTREPGGSPFAEQVRRLILDRATAPHSPLSEALLFSAARADHLEVAIRPALAAGRWVVCDRFSDSTRVYQGTAGGLDDAVLDTLDRVVIQGTMPDLTIILDLPPEAGLARASSRRVAGHAGAQADAYEQRDLLFHRKLRAGYQAIAKAEPLRCILLDGAKGEDEIAAELWAEVERRLLRNGR